MHYKKWRICYGKQICFVRKTHLLVLVNFKNSHFINESLYLKHSLCIFPVQHSPSNSMIQHFQPSGKTITYSSSVDLFGFFFSKLIILFSTFDLETSVFKVYHTFTFFWQVMLQILTLISAAWGGMTMSLCLPECSYFLKNIRNGVLWVTLNWDKILMLKTR